MTKGALLTFSLLLISYIGHTQALQEVLGIGSNGVGLDVKTGFEAVEASRIAIRGISQPNGSNSGSGTGGVFTGGRYGVRGFANSSEGSAINGYNKRGLGLFVSSDMGHAGAFKGADGKASIVLNGSDYFGGDDDGIIMIDPAQPNGDMGLVSYDDVVIQLDKNGDETGFFKIQDGKRDNTNDGYDLFRVRDDGNVYSKSIGVNVSNQNEEIGDLTVRHNEAPIFKQLTNGDYQLDNFVGLHIVSDFGRATLVSYADDLVVVNEDRNAVAKINLSSGVYFDKTSLSDQRLKKNIVPVGEVLPSLLDMGVKKYQLKGSYDRTQIGFIAQDVLEYFPEIVNYDGEHYSLNYDRFGVLAVKGLQEQQQKIETLEAELALLKRELRTLANNYAQLTSTTSK